MGDTEAMGASTLDPVAGVLAVLDEGAATGTNKFGLLLAILDLAPTVGASGELEVDRIAEKLIELHWDHARPYHAERLRQVTSGNRENSRVVLVVDRLHKELGEDRSFEQARLSIPLESWKSAVRDVANATVKNPLRLLQRLPGMPASFLYEQVKGTPRRIRFVGGALASLVQFGPALRELVEFRFARFVAMANRATLGPSIEDDLTEHLFGAERHMPPTEMRHELWALQGRKCLYTGRALRDPGMPGSNASLDHVVPWSRARLSTVENFLFTSDSLNSQKGKLLLAPSLLRCWTGYLGEAHAKVAAIASTYGWPSDLERVQAVAASMYRNAGLWSGTWAGPGPVNALGAEGRDAALAALNELTVA
jgi:hypothetical protein